MCGALRPPAAAMRDHPAAGDCDVAQWNGSVRASNDRLATRRSYRQPPSNAESARHGAAGAVRVVNRASAMAAPARHRTASADLVDGSSGRSQRRRCRRDRLAMPAKAAMQRRGPWIAQSRCIW